MADKKKHQDYWTKRVDEIIRYADQIDIDVFAEIARIYLEEAKLVQKELFAFYQRFADDNGLTLQEAMYQLRHEDMSDYQQNAKRYFEQAEKDPELLKRLNEQYASARATRMDLLNLELTWRAGVLATSISSTFENHLLKTAKYAYRKAGDRRGTINEPALRELIRTPINGKNYSEHIWGNVDKLAEDLRQVFRRGFIRGLHPREMAQEIAKKYNVARSRAQTIIRTDGTAIISNSVAKRYMDAGLKYYRILVHLDDRTTDICRQIAKEDKRYELSEMKVGLNAPPFHYNCRSGIVPDDEELLNPAVEYYLFDSKREERAIHGVSRNMMEHNSSNLFDNKSDKLYNKSRLSGAISKARGNVERQEEAFAERYYEQLRNSKRSNIVERMVQNSGLETEKVEAMLTHLLDNKYLIYDSFAMMDILQHFYPDYDIARSLQRLHLGGVLSKDIVMAEHEALEYYYMNEEGLDYEEAHRLANLKFNYEELLLDEKTRNANGEDV